MKYLIPVDSSDAALAPVAHLARVVPGDAEVEALVLNVQPRLNRHVARFTRRVDRDAFRAERSRAAMARAIDRLARAGVPHRALTEIGSPAERIAAVAEAEGVDEILMGAGRHPRWLCWLHRSVAQDVIARTDIPVTVMARGEASALERYLVPLGLAGVVALLIAD